MFGYHSALRTIIQVLRNLSSIFREIMSDRWRKSADDIWSCALDGRILSLRQDSAHLHFKAAFPNNSQAPLTPPSSIDTSLGETPAALHDTEDLVRHYLNLGPRLTDLYESWSRADNNFKRKAPKFTGIRILKQNAWEALVGFICSSNNNIIRISQMVSENVAFYQPSLPDDPCRWRNCVYIMVHSSGILGQILTMTCHSRLHSLTLKWNHICESLDLATEPNIFTRQQS